MRALGLPILLAGGLTFAPGVASADPPFMPHLTFLAPSAAASGAAPAVDPLAIGMSHLTFLAPLDAASRVAPVAAPLVIAVPQQTARPAIFEYSDGYRTRLKIHKIASFATIPLFVAEAVVGQSLYNDPTPGKRTAHLWIATSIGALFGVNSVTGIWNLKEASKDPNGRGRRLTHSILMLAADAGFFATAVTGPGHHFRDPSAYDSSRSLHRTLAFTSVSLASVGYAIMLFPH
jgi:hypothetical protein